ncbi:MAG: hypothetical protein AVDCRST_MAG13-1752, partial [uncultured Solirubrobacteraceae bacterium]
EPPGGRRRRLVVVARGPRPAVLAPPAARPGRRGGLRALRRRARPDRRGARGRPLPALRAAARGGERRCRATAGRERPDRARRARPRERPGARRAVRRRAALRPARDPAPGDGRHDGGRARRGVPARAGRHLRL